ncbi:MAG: prepilin-type N-terminal cleavage/methylation domain-containing protein [Gemmatimonadota bacterium]|nr:prepilin-type N-terminal cleavage/methylation domain-containing protein [Gemmatimonadota bacterium]
MKSRRAFTLIEIVVAVMILTVGLLGLASTAGIVARLIGAGGTNAVAAAAAASRFEMLRATPCAGIGGGSFFSRGVREDWSARAAGARLFDVADSLSYVTALGARTQGFRSLVSC